MGARSESKCNFFKGKCCMTKTYKQLTMDERTFIQLGLMMALKPAQIALELSRSTSTITRELQRNGWIRPVKLRGRGRPAHSGCYQSVAAQDRARALTVKPKTERRLQVGNVLWGKVTDYLKLGYSPEQIAGTLKLIQPHAAKNNWMK